MFYIISHFKCYHNVSILVTFVHVFGDIYKLYNLLCEHKKSISNPGYSLLEGIYNTLYKRKNTLTKSISNPGYSLLEGIYNTLYKRKKTLTKSISNPGYSLLEGIYNTLYKRKNTLTKSISNPGYSLVVFCSHVANLLTNGKAPNVYANSLLPDRR